MIRLSPDAQTFLVPIQGLIWMKWRVSSPWPTTVVTGNGKKIKARWKLVGNLDQSEQPAIGGPARMSSYADQADTLGLKLLPDSMARYAAYMIPNSRKF